MSFYVVLIIIIVALIGILVLNQRYSNNKDIPKFMQESNLLKRTKH